MRTSPSVCFLKVILFRGEEGWLGVIRSGGARGRDVSVEYVGWDETCPFSPGGGHAPRARLGAPAQEAVLELRPARRARHHIYIYIQRRRVGAAARRRGGASARRRGAVRPLNRRRGATRTGPPRECGPARGVRAVARGAGAHRGRRRGAARGAARRARAAPEAGTVTRGPAPCAERRSPAPRPERREPGGALLRTWAGGQA
jgi:hypothetical protein